MVSHRQESRRLLGGSRDVKRREACLFPCRIYEVAGMRRFSESNECYAVTMNAMLFRRIFTAMDAETLFVNCSCQTEPVRNKIGH